MRMVPGALVVSAALLAGCSSGGGGATASNSSAPASSSASGGGSSSGPEPSGSASAAGAPPAAVAKQQTATIPGPLKGTIMLGVSPVQVRGKLATVQLTFMPNLPEESADKSFSLFTLNGGNSVPAMTLVDPVNLKRYAVVKDSNGKALEPEVTGVGARSGGSASGTYTFAAPPDGVMSVDVYFSDFPPFRDVQVTR